MIRRLKKDVLTQLPMKRRQQVTFPFTAFKPLLVYFVAVDESFLFTLSFWFSGEYIQIIPVFWIVYVFLYFWQRMWL